MKLSADSTLAQWLADPVGGFLVRDYLRHAGIPEALTVPAHSLSLAQLQELSGGRIPAQVVADLVAAYERAQ